MCIYTKEETKYGGWKYLNNFDVIVIGGGHAGIEAAAAAARCGATTLLLTLRIDSLGEMSCNPAIGGQAKGHIVREVDIFGGLIGRAADFSAIQYRILNRSKGEAVRATRSQNDRRLYHNALRSMLFSIPRLALQQDEVIAIATNDSRVSGVVLRSGLTISCRAVVVTAGTFLQGRIVIGDSSSPGGRLGEPASNELSKSLVSLGHPVIRLKTGTPVRLRGDSIDFSVLEEQPGDTDYTPFSISTRERLHHQIPCHITYTNERTHVIIRDNLHRSPLYGTHKSIEGIGPRYCPSIEDKIVKFAHHDRHQIFLEPEGWDRLEYYPNGISTSLPLDVQEAFVRTIRGLEHAIITRPAYAIEYDAFNPCMLRHTLESKEVPGLFLAGQVNGTSGYEEAAIQGLVAGVNAALSATDREEEPFILDRKESYGGVLIDDIVTRGIDEPYRMFSSRAEHRLFLRDDNTTERLLSKAWKYRLLSPRLYKEQRILLERVLALSSRLEREHLVPSKEINSFLAAIGEAPLSQPTSYATLLRRPSLSPSLLAPVVSLPPEDTVIWEKTLVRLKYEPYLAKTRDALPTERMLAAVIIPHDFSFHDLPGISREIAEKIARYRPETLRDASRIPGVTPAAIAILYLHLTKRAPHGWK